MVFLNPGLALLLFL